MRFLNRYFFAPKSDAAVDAADADDVAIDAKDARLKLPKRRDDVEDWEPPVPRHMPHAEQARTLVALFQSEGRFGPIVHWELEASYAECAWVNGYIQITPLQLARALGTICTKVRLDVLSDDGEVIRASHYLIPAPVSLKETTESDNVIPIGNIGPKKRAISIGNSRSGTRNKAQQAKSAGRKARYRADIAEAVACNS